MTTKLERIVKLLEKNGYEKIENVVMAYELPYKKDPEGNTALVMERKGETYVWWYKDNEEMNATELDIDIRKIMEEGWSEHG